MYGLSLRKMMGVVNFELFQRVWDASCVIWGWVKC